MKSGLYTVCKLFLTTFAILLISGCVNHYDENINSCISEGSFGGNNFCHEDVPSFDCTNGVPFSVVSSCIMSYAKEVNSHDHERAIEICNELYEMSLNHFDEKDGSHTMSSAFRVSCMTGIS